MENKNKKEVNNLEKAASVSTVAANSAKGSYYLTRLLSWFMSGE
jgi:hypothetical protein